MTQDTLNKISGVKAAIEVVKDRIKELKEAIPNEPKPLMKELIRNSLKDNKIILELLTDLAYELDSDLQEL